MATFLFSDSYLADLDGGAPPAIHPRFTDMITYLDSVAPNGRLPGRQHIDPVDLRHVLPLINLVDVERDESDGRLGFRFRLVGERQQLAARRNITRMRLEEVVLPELLPRIRGNMVTAVKDRLPVYDCFPMPHEGRQFIASQRMYYPLAADGELVDMLLILNGYEDPR